MTIFHQRKLQLLYLNTCKESLSTIYKYIYIWKERNQRYLESQGNINQRLKCNLFNNLFFRLRCIWIEVSCLVLILVESLSRDQTAIFPSEETPIATLICMQGIPRYSIQIYILIQSFRVPKTPVSLSKNL